MFTGIVEEVGKIKNLTRENSNLHIEVEAAMTPELAIQETLNKTNLDRLSEGDLVNLERGMKLGDRLDGHIVQGHVDQTATCIAIKDIDGSWQFTFEYDPKLNNITIEKGSITVNGVSLTVVNSEKSSFSVAIIPYTFENTIFKKIEKGTIVNLEFDVIGKYVKRISELA